MIRIRPSTISSTRLAPAFLVTGLVAVSVVVSLASSAVAQPLAQPVTADSVPGLQLLRGDELPGLEAQIGVSNLDELTFYDIDQAFDDVSGIFNAALTLHWTNLTGAPVEALPLLLYSNVALDEGGDPGTSGQVTILSAAAESGPSLVLETVRPSLAMLRFERPLAPGEQLVARVEYEGFLRQLGPDANNLMDQVMSSIGALTGAGAADYGLLAMGDGLVTVASAYPMVAPFREGRFDHERPAEIGDLAYNQVANFRVRTVIPAGLTLVSNLVDAPPIPTTDGAVLVVSEGALVRDLVWVASRDFVSSSEQVGQTTVRSWFLSRDLEAGQAALEMAASSLRSYESRFGPYPYTELDVVEASLVGGAGGVEFSSMVLIAGMLYRDPLESLGSLGSLLDTLNMMSGLLNLGVDTGPGLHAVVDPMEQMRESFEMTLNFTVAHEVGHQYFAGIVGNDSHLYPVIDEPLAQYLAGLAIEDRFGDEAAQMAMDTNVLMNYAAFRMIGGDDRAAASATDSFSSTLEYAGIVYGKAPYLYVALRESLGDAGLHDAMRLAIAQLRFQLSTLEDWLSALEMAAGGPASGVRTAAQRWLYEAHGDADLGVDDSGQLLLSMVLGPDLAAQVNETFAMLGMQPADLFRMFLGGGEGSPLGSGGLNPFEALRALESTP